MRHLTWCVACPAARGEDWSTASDHAGDQRVGARGRCRQGSLHVQPTGGAHTAAHRTCGRSGEPGGGLKGRQLGAGLQCWGKGGGRVRVKGERRDVVVLELGSGAHSLTDGVMVTDDHTGI